MVKVNHILAVIVWVSVCVVLARGSEPAHAFLFFVPFTLGPHAVSHALCFVLKSCGAAILLGIGMLAYVSWFFFVYIDAFYWNLDAQSAIALLFVGVVSLPVMIPVWAVALVLEGAAKRRVD
tara:strand:+ start:292 stop:657 length:366 start_codon:yes stop_codon:yes gene_type:complete